MPAIECQGDPLQPEADARGVGDLAVGGADAEEVAEVVLMVVERDDGRRLLVAADRCHDLELEALIALVDREQFPAATEKRV